MPSPALLAMIKANKNKFARFGGKAYRLKEGRTRIRVLPSLDPEAEFWQPVAVHWIKADEQAKPSAVVGDREFTFNEPTTEITHAIKRAMDAAQASGEEDNYKLYKSWLPKKGILLNALIRDGVDASDEPKVLDVTPTLYSEMMGTIELYMVDEEPIYALDLKEGFDFIVERAGKGFDTTYTLMKAPSSKPVNKAVMEKLINLREFVEKEHFRPGEDQKALMAIANLSGMSISAALAAPRGTALLTSKAASLAEEVADEVVEEVAPAPAPKAAPKAAAAAPKAAAAAPKAAPAAPKAAPAKVEAPATGEFGADLDVEELDGMLSELDGLVAA